MEDTYLADQKASAFCQSTKDKNRFETIYNRYVGKVYQKCLSMTQDPETSKDFTQDIFIKVYFKLKTFENRSSFSTWLYSIAHNHCLDQLRLRKRTRVELLSDIAIVVEAESDQSTLNQWHIMECMMNDLPSQEATLLRLKYEQGLSIKAISERYQLSESAIKMRLLRTRDKLQTMYMMQYGT
ncbi:sigma-70 family RNA polymerase sigma factor [Spirosoma sp. HMF4905]|uniref:Sigma-70 family RNA polymerase sigma factor n=1 Tax=Spirosoma arboris TaxID=2682092 RepID=A0A7K1SDR7_9BACT|nr:RNA polymerase sigma factor [Spirosoma arboris]MVM31935.1 sigma-70 family RNA polymerase sigma factor [Spirosoma arboris]